MTQPVIVTMKDVRACRVCSSGARSFCKRYSIDWNKFLAEGLPEDVLIATGNAIALQIVGAARDRQS